MEARLNSTSRVRASRLPLVDALKATACLLIVLHHLAFYGPMSDIAYPSMPYVIDWLYEYGRMAVQVFFVVAGYLIAARLAPDGQSIVTQPWRDISRRYVRLVLPLLAALGLAVVCAAIARSWMTHDSIPAAPEVVQLLSHALLLQDLLGQDALSAGVWYVAIDFQLFAATALVLRLSSAIECRYRVMRWVGPAMLAMLTMASLFIFNRDDRWDATALYFFGAYGAGAIGYWASSRQRSPIWLGLMVMVLLAALLLEFRMRIAVAGSVMLLLAAHRRYGFLQDVSFSPIVTRLGTISYSIFLVHFPICLTINAAFFQFFPQEPDTAVAGMLAAFIVSIGAGALFFEWVESRFVTERWRFALPATFAATALLVEFVN